MEINRQVDMLKAVELLCGKPGYGSDFEIHDPPAAYFSREPCDLKSTASYTSRRRQLCISITDKITASGAHDTPAYDKVADIILLVREPINDKRLIDHVMHADWLTYYLYPCTAVLFKN